MELFKIKRKRIPMLLGVDKEGNLILSEKDGVDLLLCGERMTQDEISKVAKPVQLKIQQ